MNTRLHQFLAAENLTQAQFADSINVAPAGVSHVLAGRNKPGYDFLYNMMLHYPSLNIEWLLTGRGKMYKGQDAPSGQAPAQENVSGYSQETPSLFDMDDNSGPAVAPRLQEGGASGALSPAVSAPKQPSEAAQPRLMQAPSGVRSAAKVIVFYDDGTFQEL